MATTPPGSMGVPGRAHVAFLFNVPIQFPADYDNVKVSYISEELLRRGVRVSWVRLSHQAAASKREGIEFVELPTRKIKALGSFLACLEILAFCLREKVGIAYIDEWLFFRQSLLTRIIQCWALRLAGIRCVLDQRDPYVDFEEALGHVGYGSFRHSVLRIENLILYRLVDLILLPSKAYAKLLVGEGVSASKVFGTYRGIDTRLFKIGVDGTKLRKELAGQGRFVVGWFGIMYSFRLIEEVILPLAEQLGNSIHGSFMLVGGHGELESKFRPGGPNFRFVGEIPYWKMPQYIAACDVLICPVNTTHRFTLNSAWLKIGEAISVGRPIVATRTNSTSTDYGGVRGVVWTGSDKQSFLAALSEVHIRYDSISSEALAQASDIGQFSITARIPAIVDKIIGRTEPNE